MVAGGTMVMAMARVSLRSGEGSTAEAPSIKRDALVDSTILLLSLALLIFGGGSSFRYDFWMWLLLASLAYTALALVILRAVKRWSATSPWAFPVMACFLFTLISVFWSAEYSHLIGIEMALSDGISRGFNDLEIIATMGALMGIVSVSLYGVAMRKKGETSGRRQIRVAALSIGIPVVLSFIVGPGGMYFMAIPLALAWMAAMDRSPAGIQREEAAKWAGALTIVCPIVCLVAAIFSPFAYFMAY